MRGKRGGIRGSGEKEKRKMRGKGGGEGSFENAGQQKGIYRKWKQEPKKVDAILEHTLHVIDPNLWQEIRLTWSNLIKHSLI